MKEKHYTKQLSAFINHELEADERQTVGEHLLFCAVCRKEHDEIKFGAELAQNLAIADDAPPYIWNKIEAKLGNGAAIRRQNKRFFSKNLAFASAFSLLVLTLGAVIYLNLFHAEPNDAAINKPETIQKTQPSETASAWQVERISGQPQITDSAENARLKIGETLETDASSRAKIDVADIGYVEIAPNSSVKLVNSSRNEHRLALKRGALQARIYAPPRLFVVDTPSAVAVDLGCAYKLEVDEAGNTRLHVTSGYVALERDGRESIVPAGAFCVTKKGKGLGTPYFASASAQFQKALREFDFENGGSTALREILKTAEKKDTLTLWHLLSRIKAGEEREMVLEKTLSFIKLPAGITREDVLRLDKNTLEELKNELEISWYE